MATPFGFVLFGLIAYAIAYQIYGKWYDRTVWKPDPNKTTPAHMYTDGVEYFPVTKYVLWGYQFKSVAALGPILGPFIALQYGWLPAAIWIILGNFFIGWLQDYGSIMLSIRNQGRSFGPITYEFTGASGRSTLLGFILFYLVIISATFIFLIAKFWNIFPGAFTATLAITATGLFAGYLMYKRRANVGAVTLLSLVLMVVSVYLGTIPALQVKANAFGDWSTAFWAAVCCAFLYAASILPLPTFIQPLNYISFFPTFIGVLLIIAGALISPLTGVALKQPAYVGFMPGGMEGVGPMWPILFVAIACGAISGWHSLAGASSTAKQLDVETDGHPVGAGAMLSEGLVALASVAAYMVLDKASALKLTNIGAWVEGAQLLTVKFLGFTGPAFMQTFFAVVLVLFAITVQALVTRFWRLVSSEVAGQGAFAVFGQKHVATFVGLLLPWILAITGSWNNIWLYFGGSNQLLAGLALMLITIHLARTKAPSRYTLVPAIFMIVTTLAALLWQTYKFGVAFTRDLSATSATIAKVTLVSAPLNKYVAAAAALDGLSVLIGLVLLILGIRMSILTFQSYASARSGGVTAAPALGHD